MTTLARVLLLLAALSLGMHAVNAGSAEILAHGGTPDEQAQPDPRDAMPTSATAHVCHVSFHAAALESVQLSPAVPSNPPPRHTAHRPLSFQTPPAIPPPTT